MTMNYCGRCGAANGTAARYCRQCGAELHNQAAFSSGSSPSGVEFSTRNAPKEHSESLAEAVSDARIPPPPPPPPYPASAPKTPTQASGKKSAATSATDQDPKAISESLKKVRASGPLSAGVGKKKQERFNQIIAESVGGATDGKAKTKSQAISPIAKAPAQAKGRSSAPLTPSPQANLGAAAATDASGGRKNSAPLYAVGAAATAVAALGSGSRNTGSLPGHLETRASQGPSSVLAQASGLGKQSKLGTGLRIGLIALIVVLATGGYFFLRDRLTNPTRAGAGRNLLSVEEQSAYLVRLGQREREQGHAEDAVGYFKNALSLTPNSPDIYFLLGQTHAGAGQSDEAIKSYQSLLRIVPDHLEARLQVAEIHRARGNWNAALAEYQRIIAYDQHSPQAVVALSIMESQESGKPEIADANVPRRRDAIKKIPIVLPGMAQAKISLLPTGATAATGIKPPAPTKSLEEKPDPRAAANSHKELGLRYFNVRQYRAAINEFLSALRLTPEDKDVYYFLGSSYFGLGEQAQAHDYYKRVDSGSYVGVAQSGAARTEKAAREEAKRRELMKNGLQNQVKNEINQKSKGTLNNSLE